VSCRHPDCIFHLLTTWFFILSFKGSNVNKIPFRNEKLEYLIKHYKNCNGIPYYKEVNFGLVRLRNPLFKGLSDMDIFSYLQIDLHHRCSDTKNNCKKFPLFIHSLLNLIPLHHGFHMNNKSWKCINTYQASKYEAFLQRHKRIAKFVNEVRV